MSGFWFASTVLIATLVSITAAGCSLCRPAADAPRPAARPASRLAAGPPASQAALSPLIHALVEHEPVAAVMDLLVAGADVNARDKQGRSTALYYAAARLDRDGAILPVVRAMVERGADVDARCIGGCTALSAACEASSLQVVDYLVSNGADGLVSRPPRGRFMTRIGERLAQSDVGARTERIKLKF